jgi:hypothetical protein
MPEGEARVDGRRAPGPHVPAAPLPAGVLLVAGDRREVVVLGLFALNPTLREH